MNPIALLVPGGLLLWYLTKDKAAPKVAAPASSAPPMKTAEPAASTDTFLARSEDYTDRNKVVWVLSNTFPSVWQGKVKNDPKGYPGYERAWDESVSALWQPKASTRADLVNMIDGLIALGAKSTIDPDIDAGKVAGVADANASIQAYKDSITGYHIRPLYPRWDVSKSSAWKDSYNYEFGRQLYRNNYKIESEGPCCDKWYIVKDVTKYGF